MRISFAAGLLLACAAASAAIPPPELVPVRWPWSDPNSLELLKGTAANCLLVEWGPFFAAFATAAGEKQISVLAVLKPDNSAPVEARKALAAHAEGIVLEGSYPHTLSTKVRDAVADQKALIVEITPRRAMEFGSGAPILGTFQGLWPGIQVLTDGKAKAGPSGAAWIDTNIGFLQSARELGGSSTIWLAVRPPEKQVISRERYQQAVADAAITGTRWVIAFDSALAKGLEKRDTRAVRTWQLMADLQGWFEKHPEWRSMRPAGKLAVVQDAQHGALLSGGILDMISTKHAPVRPVAPRRLSAAALDGTTMAVNVEPDALTPEQQQVLTAWERNGGTLLTAPAGWKDVFPSDTSQITLDEKKLKRIDDMWQDVSNMIGRKNLGVRLFNVSSMLSTFRAAPSGKPALVELVNYADYAIDNVTVHLLGKYSKARLFTPDGREKDLELYEVEEGTAFDLDNVNNCAVIRVE